MTESRNEIKCDLFLSFSNEDKHLVTLFKDRVEARGIRCWIDTTGGSSFDAVQDGIDDSKVFVPFISNSYLQSEHCNNEFALAIEWKKDVLPVKLVEGRWPPKGKLAAGLLNKPSLDGTKEINDGILFNTLETMGIILLSSSSNTVKEEHENEGEAFEEGLRERTDPRSGEELAPERLPLSIPALVRLLRLESVKSTATEVIRVANALNRQVLSAPNKQVSLTSGVANILTLLLRERSVKESGGAVASVAKVIAEIAKHGPGKYAFVEAGTPSALVALATENTVKRDGVAAGRIAAALWKLSLIDVGNQACIDAGAVSVLTDLAKERSVKENGHAAEHVAGTLCHFARCDSGRQECIDANLPFVFSAMLLEKHVVEISEAILRITGTLYELSKSESGRQACIDANIPSILNSLVQEKACTEHQGAAGNIASVLMEIATTDAGREACISSGSPQALVALAGEKVVQENGDVSRCVYQALKELSKSESGKKACLSAGFSPSTLTETTIDKTTVTGNNSHEDVSKGVTDTLESTMLSSRTRFKGFVYSIVMNTGKSPHGFIYVKQTTDPELWSRVQREAPDSMRKYEGQPVATIVFQASEAVEGEEMIPLEITNRLNTLPPWRNQDVTFDIEYSSKYHKFTGHRVRRVSTEPSRVQIHPYHELAHTTAHEKAMKASVSRGLIAMGAGETMKIDEQMDEPILQRTLSIIGNAHIYYVASNETLIAACDYLRRSLINSHSSLAIDMHGVQLGKDGEISILQMSCGRPLDPVFIVDIVQLKTVAFKAGSRLRLLLEDETIPKLFFDVRGDANALYHQFRINIRNIEDLQLIDIVKRRVVKYSNFTTVFSVCQDIELSVKHQVQSVRNEAEHMFAQKFGGNYNVWMKRPLHPTLLEFAADVRFYNLMRSSVKPFTPAHLSALQRATERRLEHAQEDEFSVTDASNGNTDNLFLQELVSGPVIPCMICSDTFPLSRLLLCNADGKQAVKHALCAECLDGYAKVQISEQRISDGVLRCTCDRDGMKPGLRCTAKPWTIEELNKVLSKETINSFLRVASTSVQAARGIAEDGGASIYVAAAHWNSKRISNQSTAVSGASSSLSESLVEKAPDLLPHNVVELARILRLESVKRDAIEVARIAIWVWGIGKSPVGKQACITADVQSALADLLCKKHIMANPEASRSVYGALEIIAQTTRTQIKESLFNGSVMNVIVKEGKIPHGYIRVSKEDDLELWLKLQRETPEKMRTIDGQYIATIVFQVGREYHLQEFLTWKGKDVTFEVLYSPMINTYVAQKVRLKE